MSSQNIFTGLPPPEHLHNVNTEQTPNSHPVGFTPSVRPSNYVNEEKLIAKLKKLMKMNLKNFCYQDAIFFADKILHL
jgi:hypothetical protein